ncbi:hypothetical protein Pint_26724 [Pistacia integerrima]|uniref:Uncharacterized protein n=1 Tax=Pistacia integerrima TaxID=434235 RepID=A0ACC0YRM3_9ROSI|nr:hypothetical protein Pint_26724 [Pistacia integerrima]
MFDELPTLSLNSEGYIMFFVEHGSENSIDFSKVKNCGVRLFYAKDNYMGTDAKVDRDQRLKPIVGLPLSDVSQIITRLWEEANKVMKEVQADQQ